MALRTAVKMRKQTTAATAENARPAAVIQIAPPLCRREV